MSGELINTDVLIQKNDIFESGYGNFSSRSIRDLFDVNNDGVVSAEEMDRMQNPVVLNTLDSIHPAVARAFSDEHFRLSTGAYLTQEQKVEKEMFIKAIERALLIDSLRDVPEDRFETNELNIEEQELDTNDLAEDLKKRQYLNQAEIDNNV